MRQSLPLGGKQNFEPMTNGVEPSLLNHRPPTGRRSRTSEFQPINREDSVPGSIFGHSPIAEPKNIGLLQISGSEVSLRRLNRPLWLSVNAEKIV